MDVLNNLSLPMAVGLFLACAVVIGVVGTRLTRVVDELADRTGLGEAIAGAVMLGMVTSLSGITVSVSAALGDRPELAMSNALGGIAVQTLFLTIADMAHRRANLEHAAASIGNMMQGTLLLCLLALLLIGRFSPDITFWSVHPITPILFFGYVFGLRLVSKVQTDPMWSPASTRETKVDEPEEGNMQRSLTGMVVAFVAMGAIIGVAGWLVEASATVIADETGISQAAAGVLLTSIATSLPELVTTVSAVRRGALTLAVAGIIGGNAFDVLFAGAADIAYREGSIYHAIPDEVSLWIALSLLMIGVLLAGLIRREEQGPGRIGFESVTMIGCYAIGVVMILVRGNGG